MIAPTLLEKIKPFESLKPETKKALSVQAFERTFRSGQTLVIEGDPAHYGYFLLSGEVRVLRMSRDGRVQILARFGPGSPLNIISLLNSEAINRASIEALTQVKTLVLDKASFTKFLATFPDFSNMLLQIFAERITHLTDLAASLSLYTVRARLARFLIELADSPQSSGWWTQDEIAAQIGTVRDVVGRLLREFEAENMIVRDRQKIRLLNRQTLLKVAKQDDM